MSSQQAKASKENHVPVIAFFNNKGGVGKTTLTYHLAWMYTELGLHVLVGDLDPQANLSSAFLSEERLEQIWEQAKNGSPSRDKPEATVLSAIQPITRGVGDIAPPHIEYPLVQKGKSDTPFVQRELGLLVGDLSLSLFEDQLAESWPRCLGGDERSFRVISAFWRVLQRAAADHKASIILVDLGPNLGSINRAALIASDYVVIPLSPDLFSLQGLSNLGPQLRKWRKEWKKRYDENESNDLILPQGKMQPIGYVILQHAVRLNRPVKAFERWIERIPGVYQKDVLQGDYEYVDVSCDRNCLALIKDYQSLVPMAQEVRKPIFHLTAADKAFGNHLNAVRDVYKDFERLARRIATGASATI